MNQQFTDEEFTLLTDPITLNLATNVNDESLWVDFGFDRHFSSAMRLLKNALQNY
jgi:hypothetical protein